MTVHLIPNLIPQRVELPRLISGIQPDLQTDWDPLGLVGDMQTHQQIIWRMIKRFHCRDHTIGWWDDGGRYCKVQWCLRGGQNMRLQATSQKTIN